MARDDYDVTVVGAGAVGLASALWLQRHGARVAVVDERGPGEGASYGNAGAIATYGCIPISTPDVWRELPHLLLSRDSPLAVQWSYLPRLAPWLLRFLRNCTRARTEEIAGHLARILSRAEAGYEPLFAEAGADDLLRRTGCLYLYHSDHTLRKSRWTHDLRRRLGVEMRELARDEVPAIEPEVASDYVGGVFFPNSLNIADPHAFCARLAGALERNGAALKTARATGVASQDRGCFVRTDQGAIRSEQVVIAAGAWANSLAGSLGERFPLETERGYHLIFPGHGGRVSRPVCPAEIGFYATPAAAGLKVVGTVEMAGLERGPAQPRLDLLQRWGERLLPGLGKPASSWLGFRPSLPDALPVIGRSSTAPKVIYAFGHQHLGVTLGGVTGKLVAQLAQGNATDLDLAPYAPQRFSL